MDAVGTVGSADHPGTTMKSLLTIREFHALLGFSIGINAIRSAVKSGRIRSLLVGQSKRLIPASELSDWPRRETEATACSTN